MKKYYAEREHALDQIDFISIKYSFLRIYKQFFYDNYFVKEGFEFARTDPVLFLFRKLGSWNIWPFEKKIETYDEATLFSVIEFLYEYVYNKAIDGSSSLEDGQKKYRSMVNDILRYYNGGYKLSEYGEIKKLSPPGFEPLIEGTIETNHPEDIDSIVSSAISKYLSYNASIDDKKQAVRNLADVLEYLKKGEIKLNGEDNKDLFHIINKDLFHIINKFDIRHHNRSQQSDYDKDVWYDWMFYTFLASIHAFSKLNAEKILNR
ncbi:hypothetical protein MSSIH_2134 [Methanosarcina siciliae HI350]|uniref:Uncharacterized protein n=1 Tax=Methanosarcina siciliae HI350 TaxID=1434119 RepID=A0A0E3PE07_9EURY|nr:hypothetical protein [Methanosarcina siciliae]AKB32824.1 hypothetical protein MSSIH_2134 [Methanosarcina siciliae HI350]